MNPAVEQLSDAKVKLTVDVPAHDVHHAVEHAANDLAATVRIPGFRKGKVPRPILLQRGGKERLYSEAVERHIGGGFRTAGRMGAAVARHRSGRLGIGHVVAHSGSVSKEWRLAAEQRLKRGELKALVATASLELGIDIGDVDLVCQIGSPRSIAAFLQRAGRASHTVRGVPKARLFPLSRDELVECTALLDAVSRGELDRLTIPEKPLDVLAQQIVAEVAARDWPEPALYEVVKRAYP